MWFKKVLGQCTLKGDPIKRGLSHSTVSDGAQDSTFLLGFQGIFLYHSKGLGLTLFLWVVCAMVDFSHVSVSTRAALLPKISASKKSLKTVLLGDPAF